MSFEVIPLVHDTDFDHFIAFASLYEMLLDNFIEHDTVANQVMQSKKDLREKFEKRDHDAPVTTFVVYNDGKPVGYGYMQPHFDEKKDAFESHSYAFAFTVTKDRELERFIHEQLMNNARELEGHEVIFYFVESEEEFDLYTSWGGNLVEKGFTYELSVYDADIPALEYFTKLRDFDAKTLEEPTKEQIEPFLEVYNQSKEREPKGDSTRPFEPKTIDELMEVFTGNQYDNVISLGWYKGEPAAISHFGLTEYQNFVYQRHTGVHPDLWGNRIGTAIKAHSLLWVMDYHPEYTRITTEVLDENKAMIEVNKKLGFEMKKLQATIEFEL